MLISLLSPQVHSLNSELNASAHVFQNMKKRIGTRKTWAHLGRSHTGFISGTHVDLDQLSLIEDRINVFKLLPVS